MDLRHVAFGSVGYREHPSSVVRLNESGAIVAYPPAEESDCTVWAAIPDVADEWEGILARRTAPDRAELVGIPLFVYDLNLGDEVRLMKSAEGADVATGVASDSGNYTFRALFESEAEPGAHWRPLMNDLHALDTWFDTWSETLIAISASADHAQAVADYLARREGQTQLRYETGRLGGHP